MAKRCALTGKASQVGGQYSNRVRATQFNPTTKVRRRANLHRKRIYIPELGRTVTLTLSTRALRTIAKLGPYQALKKAGVI